MKCASARNHATIISVKIGLTEIFLSSHQETKSLLSLIQSGMDSLWGISVHVELYPSIMERFLPQSMPKLSPWWEPIDMVTMALVLWASVWYTDCWGRWTKPDPLIFEQVRDRREFENRPKKSRNIVTLLQVGVGIFFFVFFFFRENIFFDNSWCRRWTWSSSGDHKVVEPRDSLAALHESVMRGTA